MRDRVAVVAAVMRVAVTVSMVMSVRMAVFVRVRVMVARVSRLVVLDSVRVGVAVLGHARSRS